jgi:hypothetical protein
MKIIADMIEQKIQEAIEKGEFKNLPGEGKPIDLDEDSSIPTEMRMAYRVLKNSGFVPPEIAVHQEIQEIRRQISDGKDLSKDEYQKLKLKLVEKESAYHLAMERLASKK